jgi:hypothetical protein
MHADVAADIIPGTPTPFSYPPTEPPTDIPTNVRRSSCLPKPSRRQLESFESAPAIVAFEAQVVLNALLDNLEMVHPMAFAATADPDTMYLDQAMREPDREKFIETNFLQNLLLTTVLCKAKSTNAFSTTSAAS